MDFYTKALLDNVENIIHKKNNLLLKFDSDNKMYSNITVTDIAVIYKHTVTCMILTKGLWKNKHYDSVFNIKENTWAKLNPLLDVNPIYHINIYILRYGL